jgi:hypothetical protein
MLINGSSSPSATAARARRSLTVGVCVGVAIATLVWGALPAEGETEPQSSPGAASCPSQNPPNELTLAAGTPQTSMLGSAFATNLQVAFTNSNGCPLTTAVAGIPVAFSAPSTGASGSFSASGSNTVTVGSDASGMAAAPIFTANYAAGGYKVTATSAYGSISFSLTNVEASKSSACDTASDTSQSAGEAPTGLAGIPSKLTVGVGAMQSTPTGTRFPIHFAVTVTDADKNPVPGVMVTFAAPNRGPSGYFTVRSGGAHTRAPPAYRSRRAEVRTDACGVALAPTFTANRREGGYVVVASVERMRAAFALVNEGR